MSSGVNPIAAFAEAIRDAGLPCPQQILPDGKIHRFSTNGNESDRAGYYALFDNGNGHFGGFFGCWRSGIEEIWSSFREDQLSEKERAQIEKQIEHTRKEVQEVRAKAQIEAQQKAQEEYDNLRSVQEHPYPRKKGVGAYGMLPLKVDKAGKSIFCPGSFFCP